MSSVVWAALVGVGGTVIVAVTGFVSTRKATTATVWGERGHRLWEKRAVTYQEALRALVQRKYERRAVLYDGWMEKEAQSRLQAILDKYDQGRWFDVTAANLAYATDRVLDAMDAATEADRKVRDANAKWRNLMDQHQHADPPQQMALVTAIKRARLATQAALDECNARDDDLIELVRNELRAERYLPRPPKWSGLLEALIRANRARGG